MLNEILGIGKKYKLIVWLSEPTKYNKMSEECSKKLIKKVKEILDIKEVKFSMPSNDSMGDWVIEFHIKKRLKENDIKTYSKKINEIQNELYCFRNFEFSDFV